MNNQFNDFLTINLRIKLTLMLLTIGLKYNLIIKYKQMKIIKKNKK